MNNYLISAEIYLECTKIPTVEANPSHFLYCSNEYELYDELEEIILKQLEESCISIHEFEVREVTIPEEFINNWRKLKYG